MLGHSAISIKTHRHRVLIQWSSLPIQAQARGESLPKLRKACGQTSLLVITEGKERWEQRLIELYIVTTIENTNLSL